jgi:hypothetical protein
MILALIAAAAALWLALTAWLGFKIDEADTLARKTASTGTGRYRSRRSRHANSAAWATRACGEILDSAATAAPTVCWITAKLKPPFAPAG